MKPAYLVFILLGVFLCYLVFSIVRAVVWTLLIHWMGIALFLAVSVVLYVCLVTPRRRE